MNNKNLLIFLLIIIAYINIFIPLSDENKKLVQNILSTKKIIQKDKFYIAQSKKIYQELNQSNNLLEQYTNNLFYKEDSTQIFSLMQKEIKRVITTNKIHEDLIKWGESYKESNFIVFPMQVRVSGSIKNIGKFFDKINTNLKINIKNFSMERTDAYYILRISLYAVKRD